ncbi:hypothetical protein ACIA8K_04720 [Catenuloplanes sp. NPDC051500]|uniref:hypothetical protein n=1 Tax=Catenuloplanes sp. NPDC051500 TaxID=3363959 RepID=UPI003798E226
MTLLLCLNEHSHHQADITARDLGEAFTQLIAVVQAVRLRRTDTALVAEAYFHQLLIGDGVVFAEWQADGRNRDAARFLKLQLTRAPFSSVLDTEIRSLTRYTFDGTEALGLGTAHLVGGLAVSFALSPAWDVPHLELHREELLDDGEIETSSERIPHASVAAHVDLHDAWIRSAGTSGIRNGPALWAVRNDLLPNLRFLPRVEDDLARLQPALLPSVWRLLAAFEGAVAGRDTSSPQAPTWPVKVTPEHEQRKRLCYFDDPAAGGTMAFDTHARFTPWAGRMHFRWDAAAGKVVIAYIGDKLR